MKGKIAAFYGTKLIDARGGELTSLSNGQEVEVLGEPVILLGKGEYLNIEVNGKFGYVPVAQVDVDFDEYDPTYGLSVEEMNAALYAEQIIVDNGRVEQDADGGFNYRSYVGELSFEAGENGFDADTASRMAQFAADRNGNVNEER